MYYPYDAEAPECSFFIMETMVYPVFTAVPTGNYDWTKNLIFCVDHNTVKPNMNYFPKKAYYDYYGQWVIIYH